ncbi:MAG: Gfo/Idh/MocA family oxidoreductase [Clostridia bacterium]|nr:Gfo/Idh/MocA family oxidoreductase [Clostridia bacterium]
MNKVRIAVLGTGPRWNGLADSYLEHPEMEVVAVCDTAEGLAEESAAKIKTLTGVDPKVFHSYEDMVKGAAYDAVMITCDPDVQVDYAVAEMDRGIHVMTEVPAAYTIDQCFRLVNAVRKNGVKYQLAEQTRYWYFIKEWRKMAERGEFGRIFYAEGEYLHYSPDWDFFRNKKTGAHVWTHDPSYDGDPEWERNWRYRAFQDPIWYLPHELSPLLSITGGRIEKVSCVGTNKDNSYTEGFSVRDLECALMYNSNDVVFSLRAGFTAPYGWKRDTACHWYQIKGTGGSVESARSTLDLPKQFRPDTGWIDRPEWGCVDPEADEIFRNASHGGADLYPIYYFIDAILHDKQPPMDVYKAVETAAPAILAAESANRGGELLEVPDFRK